MIHILPPSMHYSLLSLLLPSFVVTQCQNFIKHISYGHYSFSQTNLAILKKQRGKYAASKIIQNFSVLILYICAKSFLTMIPQDYFYIFLLFFFSFNLCLFCSTPWHAEFFLLDHYVHLCVRETVEGLKQIL